MADSASEVFVQRISVQRTQRGEYILRGSHSDDVVRWDPRRGPLHRVRFPRDAFKRQALRLQLGVACEACGFLEVEHHIDGAERAPCNEFRAVTRGG